MSSHKVTNVRAMQLVLNLFFFFFLLADCSNFRFPGSCPGGSESIGGTKSLSPWGSVS